MRRIGRLAHVSARLLRLWCNLRRVGLGEIIKPSVVLGPDPSQKLNQSRIVRALRALGMALARSVPGICAHSRGRRENRRPEEQRRGNPLQPLAPLPELPPVSPPEPSV